MVMVTLVERLASSDVFTAVRNDEKSTLTLRVAMPFGFMRTVVVVATDRGAKGGGVVGGSNGGGCDGDNGGGGDSDSGAGACMPRGGIGDGGGLSRDGDANGGVGDGGRPKQSPPSN